MAQTTKELVIISPSRFQTIFQLKFNLRHYGRSIYSSGTPPLQLVVVGLPSWQCGIPQWYVMCYYRGYLSHSHPLQCRALQCNPTKSGRQAAAADNILWHCSHIDIHPRHCHWCKQCSLFLRGMRACEIHCEYMVFLWHHVLHDLQLFDLEIPPLTKVPQ